MSLWHDTAVYLGFADETAESRQARDAALSQTSAARLLLSAVLAALVAGALVGLVRCLLDGDGVALARMIEKGWLVAAVVATAGVSRELWDRRRAMREHDQAPRSS
jgi:hypothetical protein